MLIRVGIHYTSLYHYCVKFFPNYSESVEMIEGSTIIHHSSDFFPELLQPEAPQIYGRLSHLIVAGRSCGRCAELLRLQELFLSHGFLVDELGAGWWYTNPEKYESQIGSSSQ